MRIERLLIPPPFKDREMTRLSNLLEQVDANIAVLLAARVSLLLQSRYHRRPG